MKSNRKKRLYVVGFDTDRDCIYGKTISKDLKFIDSLTINEAKKHYKELHLSEDFKIQRAIYKLVRIK